MPSDLALKTVKLQTLISSKCLIIGTLRVVMTA